MWSRKFERIMWSSPTVDSDTERIRHFGGLFLSIPAELTNLFTELGSMCPQKTMCNRVIASVPEHSL